MLGRNFFRETKIFLQPCVLRRGKIFSAASGRNEIPSEGKLLRRM